MHTPTTIAGKSAHKNVARAWERFNDTGALQPNTIRNVIGRGWIISRELGISTDKERAPTVITADEIAELERSEDLVLAGKSVLAQLTHSLKETRHVVVLADANSRILYSTGHRPIQEDLEKINFRPGADWSERLVGPNGVGTALMTQRPEVVMGFEHYCKAWQPWVCYGAPIYDAAGQIVKGVIDITGPVKRSSQESMAMAIMLAQSISANLAMMQLRKREYLRERGKQLIQKWHTDGVLILDENGHVLDYNNKAASLFGNSASQMLNNAIANLIPDIQSHFKNCLLTGNALSLDMHHRQEGCQLETQAVQLEPIAEKGRVVGAVVVLKVHQNSIVLPEVVVGQDAGLKTLGDAVIKKTLVQTNYNISRAAKLLGIDRTTIYRRMRKWSP